MPAPAAKLGILLCNLGTPKAPQTAEVRRYLHEFLSDPRVIDIHPLLRWLLLHLIILRTRPQRSAAAYRRIWSDEGSPLLVHLRALTRRIQERLGATPVVLAMRYGEPSIAKGLDELDEAGCDRLLIVPLYPHYAASSTGSTVQEVYRIAGAKWNTPYLQIVPPFYDHPAFIDALADLGAPLLAEMRADHVLYSFHGLPERHVTKSDPSAAHCLSNETCCDTIIAANRNCYRAQCHATARALTARLGLDPAQTDLSFQSRLGRTVWIRPYTDKILGELARRGVKRLAVFCPAFVADCLETLEEIGMRANQDFIAAGGEELRLVPGLNANPIWVDALLEILGSYLDEAPQPQTPHL
ncbi:MAG TPA: ferrochelatase [Nannocystis exedens]|nr:ferrochelatase [Nannocystis exedens]